LAGFTTLRFDVPLLSHTTTRRDGSLYGSGVSSTPFTTEKIAVLAPMPSASVSTTMSVKPGLFARVRRA